MKRRFLLPALVVLACSADVRAAAADDWFLEDAEHAGQSVAWLDGQPYADGFMPISGENAFTPSGGPSQGGLVTVRLTLRFDDAAPEEPPSDAQAALRLNGDRFQILTSDGEAAVWQDVAADGVPTEQGTAYELVFDLDYAAGDYGVAVVCDGSPVALSVGSATRFPLATTETNAVAAVFFAGYGGIARAEGAYADDDAGAAAVKSLEPTFGADFGILDVRVTVDLDALPSDGDTVWTLASDIGTVTGACDRATGAVTFAGLALRRSEDNACMLRADGSDGVLCRKSFTVRSGQVAELWICEDREHSEETGTWRTWQDYSRGYALIADEDGFAPTAASDGNRVTVRTTVRFDDALPEEPADGAQLAFRLNGERFQALAGRAASRREKPEAGNACGGESDFVAGSDAGLAEPTWIDVAADGVTAEPGRDYELVFDLDYAVGDYGVAVVCGAASVPLAADGVTRFPLAATGSNGVSEIRFDGYGKVMSIYGEYVDASVARADGVRYETLGDALATGKPVTVTWPKAVSGDALANAVRGSDITLPNVAEPTCVRLAPGIAVRPAAGQPSGLLTFLPSASWFDVVFADGAYALALNASAAPTLGGDGGPAIAVGGGRVCLTVANAKPGLSYAVSGVSNLSEPFAPPTDGWQRYAGESEGPIRLTTETTAPAAFFKVYAADR